MATVTSTVLVTSTVTSMVTVAGVAGVQVWQVKQSDQSLNGSRVSTNKSVASLLWVPRRVTWHKIKHRCWYCNTCMQPISGKNACSNSLPTKTRVSFVNVVSRCQGHTLSVTTKTLLFKCAMCWSPNAESAVLFGATASPTTRLSFHVELTTFTHSPYCVILCNTILLVSKRLTAVFVAKSVARHAVIILQVSGLHNKNHPRAEQNLVSAVWSIERECMVWQTERKNPCRWWAVDACYAIHKPQHVCTDHWLQQESECP